MTRIGRGVMTLIWDEKRLIIYWEQGTGRMLLELGILDVSRISPSSYDSPTIPLVKHPGNMCPTVATYDARRNKSQGTK